MCTAVRRRALLAAASLALIGGAALLGAYPVAAAIPAAGQHPVGGDPMPGMSMAPMPGMPMPAVTRTPTPGMRHSEPNPMPSMQMRGQPMASPAPASNPHPAARAATVGGFLAVDAAVLLIAGAWRRRIGRRRGTSTAVEPLSIAELSIVDEPSSADRTGATVALDSDRRASDRREEPR